MWTATRDVGSLAALAGQLSIALLATPVAIAWWLGWAAQRRRMPLLWPLTGTMTIVLAAAACQLGVGLPQASAQGYIAVTLGLPAALPTLAVMIAALAPHVLLRTRETSARA